MKIFLVPAYVLSLQPKRMQQGSALAEFPQTRNQTRLKHDIVKNVESIRAQKSTILLHETAGFPQTRDQIHIKCLKNVENTSS